MANVIVPGTIACAPGTLSGDLYTAFSALVAPADLPLVETAFKRISFAVASGWVTNVVASITDTKYLQVDSGQIIGGDGGGGGGGAPVDADYLTSSLNGTLTNQHVVSSTASVVWTFGVGTATAVVPVATTTAKGIVELATDGETSSGVAVQGNDSRLAQATTTTRGTVELATDGETAANVVVQGNDTRLAAATETTRGTVELATSAETTAGLAVQASDTRLSDSRTPTAHAASHENGGGDEINVAGLSGLLADPQTPTTHAASHANGGGDAVNVTTLAGFPGGGTTFLRDDGTFATPASSGLTQPQVMARAFGGC